jgi:hypothetical protein
MVFSVDYVEALWVILNLVTAALTLSALVDARADRSAVRLLNGHARDLAANGIVRREAIRLVVQVLLLAIAVPGLFSDAPRPLTPGLVMLMAIPILLLLSSFFDARDRKALTVLVAADLLATRATKDAEIIAALHENTRISQKASDQAEAAYQEANHVNEKLAAMSQVRSEMTEVMAETVDDTHDRVTEIHGVVVENGGEKEAS